MLQCDNAKITIKPNAFKKGYACETPYPQLDHLGQGSEGQGHKLIKVEVTQTCLTEGILIPCADQRLRQNTKTYKQMDRQGSNMPFII